MKKLLITPFLLWAVFLWVQNVQAEDQFIAQTIGGAGSDIAHAMTAAPDGGYIIVGQTKSFGAGNDDMYIVKLTATGALDTSFGSNGTRTIGGTGVDIARAVTTTSDGGYIIAGWTNSFGAGNDDMYIVKLTATGALDTSFGSNGTRTIGGVSSDQAFDITSTSDGGYIIVGQTGSFGAGMFNVYIAKLTAAGAFDTSFGSGGTRTINGAGGHGNYAYVITPTPDGGYIITGIATGFGAGGYDIHITKLTATGALDTSFGSNGTRTIGGTNEDRAYAITPTPDGGYIIAGYTNSYGAGNYDMYIVKLTATGAFDTSFGSNGKRTIGGTGTDQAFSITPAPDGGYLIVGWTNSYGAGNYDMYIVKLTATGALDTSFGSNGTRTIGGTGNDYARSVIQASDGGYIIAGRTQSFGAGSDDMYIIKITENGELTDCTHSSNSGTPTLASGGALGSGASALSSGGTLGSSAPALNSGGIFTQQCTIPAPFENCGDAIFHEGQSYDTVQIGTQCWFQENLNVGSMLASASTLPSNNSLIEKWCYNNSSAICDTDGGLYTWAEANQLDASCNTSSCTVPENNQGICPSGWHIPTDGEFKTLETHLGMTQEDANIRGARGTDQGAQMSLYTLNGTNSSGFSSLLSGYQYSSSYYNRGTYTYYWTSSEELTNSRKWERLLSSNFSTVIRDYRIGDSYGFSVRCLQNETTTPPLEDTTIQNPNPTDIQQAVTDGYITIDNGTIDNATQTTTQVNVTYRTTNIDALFPTGTVVTETNTNPFNFQNFTLESQNIKNEQPESRSAFRLGIEGTNLTFSQFVTITTFVGEAFNTQTLDILYQNEGETTWNTQGTCTVENGQCTFQTNHATIYTINGTLQSTGDTPLNINTEVLDTLTMDCYESTNGSGTYDVLLGTVSNPGYVTAGTPAIGQSTCTVTTNDDQGYYLTVEDDNGISSTVLTHTDPNTGTLYEIQDLTHWNDTTLTTENWNPPTTKGLGFSVITFPDTDTANNIFDGIWNETGNCPEGTNTDTNNYAGFPDTPETIAAVPQYTANHTTTNICYKVDVPTSQPSGVYTGSVTYTATSDASSYLN
jgi:uncharacterized protein (TIGR02145 family)/uncharacterized delta-60 repeat protein